MPGIEYFRVFSDEEGISHFETRRIEVKSKDYAPPALPLNTSSLESADNYIFLELPIGWFGVWHPTPVRQWLILMSGKCEIETGDGKSATCRAGDVVLLEDTTGKGHQTRVIGNQAVRIAAIHFS